AGDAYLGGEAAGKVECGTDREGSVPYARIDEAGFPKRRLLAVCVEGIHAVVFRGDDEDILLGAIDVDAGRDQRLRDHFSINVVRELFTELVGVDVGGSKRGFRRVCAGALVVPVLGEHPVYGRGSTATAASTATPARATPAAAPPQTRDHDNSPDRQKIQA